MSVTTADERLGDDPARIDAKKFASAFAIFACSTNQFFAHARAAALRGGWWTSHREARWANTISTFAIAVLIAIDRTSDFQEY